MSDNPPSDAVLCGAFENLGHNCEFGFVLQNLGSHESSLFRWAHVDGIQDLIRALAVGLEGLFADPTALAPKFGLTMVQDARFRIAFHTGLTTVVRDDRFIIERDAAFPKLFEAEKAKIGHLSDRFLRSLREASKIFVYKENAGVSDADARRLHMALRQFGQIRLLVVEAATPQNPAETVAELEEGLYRGYVSRFSAYDAVDQVDTQSWRALLRNVLVAVQKKYPYQVGEIESGVLIGRNGYLFLAGGSHNVFEIVTGKADIPEAAFVTFRANLHGRMAWALQRDIAYLHLIMPDKQSVIPEDWPLSTPPIRIGALYLARNTDLAANLLYPVAALAVAKAQAIRKVDTHLADYGSILVAAAVAARITGGSVDIKNELLGRIGSMQKAEGDLGMRFSPPRQEQLASFTGGSPGHFFNNQVEGWNNGGVDLHFNGAAPYPKRVLIFGDSFARLVARFLTFWFTEVLFFRSGFFHEEIASQCAPDVLITENVERYLDHVAGDEERVPFLLYPHLADAAYAPGRDFIEALAATLSPASQRHTEFISRVVGERAATATPTPAGFDNLRLKSWPDGAGEIAVLEEAREVPQRSPEFIADLSGRGLSTGLQETQVVHGSYLVQRRGVLLFGPSHLVDAEGHWACEVRKFKRQFIDMLNWNAYKLIFPGAKPAVAPQGDRLALSTAALSPEMVERVSQPVFLATPLEPDNYGRWLATVAPKVLQFRSHGAGRKFFCRMHLPWQKAFLLCLGLKEDELLPHDPGRTYILDDVTTVEITLSNMAVSAAEREMYVELVARYARRERDMPERLFLSRVSDLTKRPGYRVLRNEAELMAALSSKLGFAAVEPANFPLELQMGLLASARSVVSLGGANLYNAVFCAPGADAVTIESSANFVFPHSQLLSSLDLRYGIVFGRQNLDDPEPVHKSWTVDVDRTIEALSAFLS